MNKELVQETNNILIHTAKAYNEQEQELKKIDPELAASRKRVFCLKEHQQK